jgi:hypothetical protein
VDLQLQASVLEPISELSRFLIDLYQPTINRTALYKRILARCLNLSAIPSWSNDLINREIKPMLEIFKVMNFV